MSLTTNDVVCRISYVCSEPDRRADSYCVKMREGEINDKEKTRERERERERAGARADDTVHHRKPGANPILSVHTSAHNDHPGNFCDWKGKGPAQPVPGRFSTHFTVLL